MKLFSFSLRHKRYFSWSEAAVRRWHWSKAAAGSRWPLFLDSTETRGNYFLALNNRKNSEFENKFQKSYSINLFSCFHFIQKVLSAFISLLKSKHYFDKVSSHRDSEISAHSPPSLFQKEFSKQMKVLEIICWMSQGISFISESEQSPVRTKCVLVSTESLMDTSFNANFSSFFCLMF